MSAAQASAAESESLGPGVARVVQSLIDYTRWPDPRDPVRLCTVGPAMHATWLDGLKLANGRTAERRSIAPGGASRASCDVVYIGALPAVDQRELTSRLAGSEIMTIAEADPLCRSQAMFCLIEAGNVVNFRLNVEAVARSGLRVDPRVLRLAVGQP